MTFMTWMVPLFLALAAGAAGLLVWGFLRKERTDLCAAALLLALLLAMVLILGSFLGRT
ncbi:hypothetical protein [uncultured Oscillibacter sp.]|uniref:hypothetical protein n=1 Tax=uncultured Oscillibacter sp. TaxID=876091 RepID=UPI0026064495|nr:hypothetical protein [uncultured Oscillibacter sp.]